MEPVDPEDAEGALPEPTSPDVEASVVPRSSAEVEGARTVKLQVQEQETSLKHSLDACFAMCTAGQQRQASASLSAAEQQLKSVKRLRHRLGLPPVKPTIEAAFELAQATYLAISGQLAEACTAYAQLVAADPKLSRLRVNLGNILLRQGSHAAAIREFQQAMDQVPASELLLRARLLHNIGVAFMESQMMQDAMLSFEASMDEAPIPRAAYNLLICTFVLGHPDRCKQSYTRLAQACRASMAAGGRQAAERESTDDPQDDKPEEAQPPAEHIRWLTQGAQLIAPLLAPEDQSQGFTWCCGALQQQGLGAVLGRLRRAQAAALLDSCRAAEAAEILQGLEQEPGRSQPEAVAGGAAAPQPTQPVQGRIRQSADVLAPGGFAAAYNAALAKRAAGQTADALGSFKKLHSLFPAHAETMVQVAGVLEQQRDLSGALSWLERASQTFPGDARLLVCQGRLHHRLGSAPQALRCFEGAVAADGTCLDALAWLAQHHESHGAVQEALQLYKRASALEPHQAAWALLVLHCLRSQGQLHQAIALGRRLLLQHADSVDCLAVMQDLYEQAGMQSEASQAAEDLQRLCKALDMQVPPAAQRPALPGEVRTSSARPSTALSRRPGTAQRPLTSALGRPGTASQGASATVTLRAAAHKGLWSARADGAGELLPS